jgi:ribonucleotide reductase alpha subunit
MSRKVKKTQDLFSMIDFEEKSIVEESHNDIIIDDKENTVLEQQIIDNKNTENDSDKMENKEYKTYSVEEVKEATIKYFNGDQLAADVWMNKYALKDSDGNIFELTPDDMHHRIAAEIARIEKRYPNPCRKKRYLTFLRISNISFHKAVQWQASATTSRFHHCQIVSLSEPMASPTHTEPS